MDFRTDGTADLLTENAPYPSCHANMIGDTADLLRKRVESLQTATKEGVEIAPPLSVDEGNTVLRAKHDVNVKAAMCRRHRKIMRGPSGVE